MGINCCKDEDKKTKTNKEEHQAPSKCNTHPYIPDNSDDIYHTRVFFGVQIMPMYKGGKCCFK